MKTVGIASLILLTSCATTQPGIQVRTVEKIVEVQRPCPIEAPVRPAPLGALPSDAVSALRVVSAKLLEYAGQGAFADQAQAAIDVCKTS